MTRQRFVLSMALTFVFAGCDGGDDDDVCADCSCDPSLCDGADADADADGEVGPDGDADADADADRDDVRPDGDAPVEYGSLTVTSTPVEGAAIELDGEPTGQTTPYTFDSLPVGTHSVLLSYSGRLQAPSPAGVSVTTEGADVNIVLFMDLTGGWWNEFEGDKELRMESRPPDVLCPDTWMRVFGASPVNMICVEADDSLSLCKNRASECGRETFVEGQILEDGRKIDYDDCRIDNPTTCLNTVYTKLD